MPSIDDDKALRAMAARYPEAIKTLAREMLLRIVWAELEAQTERPGPHWEGLYLHAADKEKNTVGVDDWLDVGALVDAVLTALPQRGFDIVLARESVTRQFRDNDAVCTVCRWRGDHAPTCPSRDEPWPMVEVVTHEHVDLLDKARREIARIESDMQEIGATTHPDDPEQLRVWRLIEKKLTEAQA